MRNISLKRVLALVAVVAFAGFAQACDDGELMLRDGADLSVSPYVVLTADPMTVNKGEGTTLKWTVANADTVQIASSPGGAFSFNTEPIDVAGETEGSLMVDGITATTTFIITAKSTLAVDTGDPSIDPYVPSKSANYFLARSGQIELPEPEVNPDIVPQEVTDSVTVTVVDAGPLSATLTANPDRIKSGETSMLTCQVSPDSATYTVVSSDGQTIDMGTDCSAVVSPTETTVYTLTATDTSGKQMVATATVIVDEMSIDHDASSITANDQYPQAQVESFDAAVTVKYTIMPQEIPVTVVADKSVSCTPELPSNQVLENGTGSSQCSLSENTVFTLKAHINGNVVDVKAVSVVSAIGAGRVRITAQPWAFEGEHVDVTVEPVSAADAKHIAKIRIIGLTALEHTVVDATPVKADVTVPMTGVRVEVFSKQQDETPQSFQPVVALPLLPVGLIGKPITEVMFDPNDIERAYFGTMTDLKEEGASSFLASSVMIYRNDKLKAIEDEVDFNGPIPIPLGKELIYWFNDGGNAARYIPDSLWIEGIRTYPVRAIAAREGSASELFVGTTGAILYSADSGLNWDVFVGAIFTTSENGTDYSGSHESCAGEIQTGAKPSKRGDIAYFSGVCDIVSDGNLLYAATDKGVATFTDVDTLIANPKAVDAVHFIPKGEDSSMATYKHVANDLELVKTGGETKLFVAMATGTLDSAMAVNGVYVSTDQGITWQPFGSIGFDAYAVETDMHDGEAKKLYAATSDGIYVSDVATANWQKVDSMASYSLADDPFTTGVIVAGHDAGATITRDGGQTWKALETGGIEGSGKVTAVAMEAKHDGTTGLIEYRAAFGAESGFLAGKVTVSTTSQSVTTEPEDEILQFKPIRPELLHPTLVINSN